MVSDGSGDDAKGLPKLATILTSSFSRDPAQASASLFSDGMFIELWRGERSGSGMGESRLVIVEWGGYDSDRTKRPCRGGKVGMLSFPSGAVK